MPIRGQVFRVAQMDGMVCRRDLWCRVAFRDDAWAVTLYRYERQAEHDWEPMTSIPEGYLDLAVEAIRKAREFIVIEDGESS
jgi:hypothetical protein